MATNTLKGVLISKNTVELYKHVENYVEIKIVIGKRGKIRIGWYAFDRQKILKKCRAYRNKNKKLITARRQLPYKACQLTMSRLKINGCAICGYSEYPEALDFHHVNPKNKEFGITVSTLARSDKKVVEELNKCILLCSNCHRHITKISRREVHK